MRHKTSKHEPKPNRVIRWMRENDQSPFQLAVIAALTVFLLYQGWPYVIHAIWRWWEIIAPMLVATPLFLALMFINGDK